MRVRVGVRSRVRVRVRVTQPCPAALAPQQPLPHDTVTRVGSSCVRYALLQGGLSAHGAHRSVVQKGLVRVRVRVGVRVTVRVRVVARTAAWSDRARARSRACGHPPRTRLLRAALRLGPWIAPPCTQRGVEGEQARDRREGQPWARKESLLRRRGGGCGGALAPCPKCPHLTPPWTSQAAAEGAARGQPRRAPGHGGVGRRRPELTRWGSG